MSQEYNNNQEYNRNQNNQEYNRNQESILKKVNIQ